MMGRLRLVLILAVLSSPAAAEPLSDALVDGKLIVDARYRVEVVNQGGFARDAIASTLRARIGYETASLAGFKALVEAEGIAPIGNDRYNSTTNGKTRWPLVADPTDIEINRAQISYAANKTAVTLGRQRINIDNERFVGGAGFRQNEQTFDAVRMTDSTLDGLATSYTYVFKVRRFLGGDNPLGRFKGDTHLITAAYSKLPIGTISAYSYWVDIENAPVNSSHTLGAKLSGSKKVGDLSLNYLAEFANQNNYQRNPIAYDLNYYALEAGISSKGVGARIGYEELQGNGRIGFATPLATLHKFQGFADVFTTTPVNGVRDLYAVADTTIPFRSTIKSLRLAAWFHNFNAARGGADEGSEVDFISTAAINDQWTLEVKFATYQGHGFAANRDKFWLSLGYKL